MFLQKGDKKHRMIESIFIFYLISKPTSFLAAKVCFINKQTTRPTMKQNNTQTTECTLIDHKEGTGTLTLAMSGKLRNESEMLNTRGNISLLDYIYPNTSETIALSNIKLRHKSIQRYLIWNSVLYLIKIIIIELFYLFRIF